MSLLYTNLCQNSLKTIKCTNLLQFSEKIGFRVVHRRSLGTNLYLTQKLSQGDGKQEGGESSFVPFSKMVELRRKQAAKSILVQVQSSASFKELHSYCSNFGAVKEMFHYSTGVEPMNFILVEFASENDVESVLSSSMHLQETQIVPVKSQFLWFKAPTARKGPKLKAISKNAKLTIEDGTYMVKDKELKEMLKTARSVSDQMYKLQDAINLNDLGTRLRFLVAKQIESSISGMFPSAAAYPFGSSVNGCGKMGCDLDLVLRLKDEMPKNDSRLVFHCKAASGSERAMSQRNMEAIGDMVQLFLPGCSQVRRILQARVPIIKFYQQLADVECDLSMSNMSGVHMSDFLYMMTSMDVRVKPLVFTVRKWAHEVGLTNSSPGRWITNFSLTLLVLAFLQNPKLTTPILPTLNELVKKAEDKDKIITDEGINCTFLRDVSKLDWNGKQNKDDVATLLFQFFEYYSQFDFETKAVCLNEGIPISKPEHSALYIVNPLERGLNVSKNVSLEELERFKIELREAAWALESQENKSVIWGVLSLFESKRSSRNFNSFYMPARPAKLVEVSKLFEENEPGIDFKNDSVKNQVQDIRKEFDDKVKKLESDVVTKRKSRR